MTMRLILDIDPGEQPVSGWLERPCASRVAFTGLLELLAALDQMLGDDHPDGVAKPG